MFVRQKKMVLSGVMVVLFLLLAACDSHGSSISSTQNQGAKPSATTAPKQVTPKAARGSSGVGPHIISSPTVVAGGKPGSQQVVLGDRTLIIFRGSKQSGGSSNVTLISLSLIVQNTSAKTIKNQITFFQLISSEGDVFGNQYNSSDNFYGTIAAHANRSGTIMFEVPTAAASSLHLLYRPEVATETAIIVLQIV